MGLTFAFVSEFDCGGRGQVWCDIINDLTPDKAYNVIDHTTSLGYGQDAFGYNPEALDIANQADIIVAMPGLDHGRAGPGNCSDPDAPAVTYDGPFLPLCDKRTWADLGKPIVIWLWGSLNLRTHYADFHKAFDGIARKVWAADCDIAADGGWPMAPMPVYFPWLAPAPQWETPLKVCHTVTDRRIKNTDTLIAACNAVGDGVKLQIMECESLRKCLTAKSQCQVNFDHLQGYYGNSSIEASWMGLPNIVRIGKPAYADAIKAAWGADTIPPWHQCEDEAGLRLILKCLAGDKDGWEQSSAAHRQWHRDHWKPADYVERLFVEPCA